jgi:hypothetical protein
MQLTKRYSMLSLVVFIAMEITALWEVRSHSLRQVGI